MKKYIIISLLLMFVLPLNILAQRNRLNTPDWTDYYKRKMNYPDDTYLMGFVSERIENVNNPNEILDRLKSMAKNQLVESIYTTIKSITTSKIEATNGEAEEYFKQASVSYSNININGLNTETYHDQKKGEYFAIAYAKKEDVVKMYRNSLTNLHAKISTTIDQAEQAIKNDNKQQALKYYYEAQTKMREVEEAHTLMLALKNISIDAPELKMAEFKNQKLAIQRGISQIEKGEDLNVNDAAYLMARSLKLQLADFNEDIQITNFTYESSGMASNFSRQFELQLEQKLVQQGLQIRKATKNSKIPYILKGTYWDEGQNIKIIAVLRNADTGKTKSSVETRVSKSYLQSAGIEYKPAGLEEALAKWAMFTDDIVLSGGGLVVDVTTNKGNQDLIYTEGDTLKLFIKANKECYVRFVYHMADGTQILLYDNFYVAPNMTNKVIELPQYFECAEPFGVETLQLRAQSQEFDPLPTKEYYGYNLITNDLKTTITKSRGFKPIKQEDAVAEKVLLFTTLAQN